MTPCSPKDGFGCSFRCAEFLRFAQRSRNPALKKKTHASLVVPEELSIQFESNYKKTPGNSAGDLFGMVNT